MGCARQEYRCRIEAGVDDFDLFAIGKAQTNGGRKSVQDDFVHAIAIRRIRHTSVSGNTTGPSTMMSTRSVAPRHPTNKVHQRKRRPTCRAHITQPHRSDGTRLLSHDRASKGCCDCSSSGQREARCANSSSIGETPDTHHGSKPYLKSWMSKGGPGRTGKRVSDPSRFPLADRQHDFAVGPRMRRCARTIVRKSAAPRSHCYLRPCLQSADIHSPI